MPTTQQKISTPLLFFSLLIFCGLLIPAVSLGSYWLLGKLVPLMDPYPIFAQLLALPLLTVLLNHRIRSPSLQLGHLILNFFLLLLWSHSLPSFIHPYFVLPSFIPPSFSLPSFILTSFIFPIICACILLLPYHSPPDHATPTTYFVHTSITASLCIFATLRYSCYFTFYYSPYLLPLCAALLLVLAAYFHFHRQTSHQFSALSLILISYLFFFLIGYLYRSAFPLFVPYRALALLLHASLLYPTYKLFSYVREHPKYMTSTVIS